MAGIKVFVFCLKYIIKINMSDCGNKSMFDNKPLEMPRMWTEAFRSLSVMRGMRSGKVVLLYSRLTLSRYSEVDDGMTESDMHT